jgi:hypothetical protein
MVKEIVVGLLQNPATWVVIASILFALVAIIVKKTKTQKDDQIFAMICHAFNLAEKVPAIPGEPAWVAKVKEASKVFNDSYIAKYGSEPPDNITQFAQAQWSIIANQIKKN